MLGCSVFDCALRTPKAGGGGGSPALNTSVAAPVLTRSSSVSTHPPVINASIPADAQAGVYSVEMEAGSDATFATTTLDDVLTISDAQASAGVVTDSNFSAFTSGIGYARARLLWSASGSSYFTSWSNVVGWGDTSSPTITTLASQTTTEQAPLSVALTANKTIASWSIIGGNDQLQFQISGSTLQWIGNGVEFYGAPADFNADNIYEVTVQATDLFGNTATLALQVTVTAIDSTPNSFSFTPVTGAATTTQYTSNTVTISGLQAGFNIASSVDQGQYSKNGGAWTNAGSFTVANGDTLAVRVTSSGSASTAVTANVTVGTFTAAYIVTTAGVSKLSSTTGIDKSTYLNVATPFYQFIHNASVGALCGVRPTAPASVGKFHVEWVINHVRNTLWVGVCDSGSITSFATFNGSIPGSSSVPGMSIRVTPGVPAGVDATFNGSTVTWSLPGNWAVGDAVILEVNETTNVVDVYFYRTATGTSTKIGTATLSGVYIPAAWYSFGAGGQGDGTTGNSDCATYNPGNSTFLMTPSATYAAYG